MEALRRERENDRQNTLRGLKLNPENPRMFAFSVRVSGQEVDLSQFPVEQTIFLQNEDGEMYFVPGISALDGPDIL
jgi:hypothetical protein